MSLQTFADECHELEMWQKAQHCAHERVTDGKLDRTAPVTFFLACVHPPRRFFPGGGGGCTQATFFPSKRGTCWPVKKHQSNA